MEFVPFTPQDEDTFLRFCRGMYSSPAVDHPASADTFRATFRACLSGGQSIRGYLLMQGGAAVGYLLLVRSFSPELGGPILVVDELYLEPAFRGQGIGRAILQQLRAQAAGQFVSLKLECSPRNTAAMQLYRSLGFTPLCYTPMVLPL